MEKDHAKNVNIFELFVICEYFPINCHSSLFASRPYLIPMCTICDSIRKFFLTIVSEFHGWMISGVCQSQLPEHGVIWCWTVRATFIVISENDINVSYKTTIFIDRTSGVSV